MSRARTSAAILEAEVRAKAEAAYLDSCPWQQVREAKRETFHERIRVSLILACGHGSTRDFGATRRRRNGSLHVDMWTAESGADAFERLTDVLCVACGPTPRRGR